MFLPLNDKQFESWKLRRSAAKLGMQVWYKHVGNDPTKMADELFDKMRLA